MTGDEFDLMALYVETVFFDLIATRAGDMRHVARVISPNMDAITRAAVKGISEAIGAALAPYGVQVERAAATHEGPRGVRLYLKRAARDAAKDDLSLT